jgi:hypothetical protein
MTASQELTAIAKRLDDVANLIDAPELKGPIAEFRSQLQDIDASRSGNRLSPYEITSRVYGNLGIESNSFLSSLAKAPKEVKFAKEECASIFAAVGLSAPLDEHTTSLKTEIDSTKAANSDEWVDKLWSGHLGNAPPYIKVRAELEAKIGEFKLCADLAELCRRAARHLERVRPSAAVPATAIPEPAQRGKYVFIGHGRSLLWRELKDFLQDRLGLHWDEFNREPVAGYSTTERLSRYVERCDFCTHSYDSGRRDSGRKTAGPYERHT